MNITLQVAGQKTSRVFTNAVLVNTVHEFLVFEARGKTYYYNKNYLVWWVED